MSIGYGTKSWFEQKFDNVDALGDKWGHRFRSSQHYRLGLCLELVTPLVRVAKQLKILDIGCGLGDFLRDVQRVQSAHDFYGCDISENAIRHAQRENPFFHLQVETLPALNYPRETFDIVMAIEVLSYLNAQERALAVQKIAECVRPGGHFLFSGVVNGGERYFTEGEIRDLIERHFKIESIRFNYALLYGYIETAIYGLVALGRAYELKNLDDIDLFFGGERLRGFLKGRFARIVVGTILRLLKPLLLWFLSLKIIVVFGDRLGKIVLGARARTNMIVLARRNG